MSGYLVRRANVDDLAQLIVLWQAVDLPFLQLEKRLTEFQVVEKERQLYAAVGLQIHQHEGWLHSETFLDFGLADSLRRLLWERLEKVAGNYGLFHIWTQETAPFWKQVGFHTATKEQLVKRPVGFENNEKLDWALIQLRDPAAMPLNLDKEFERFKESERIRTDEVMSQAKLLKGVATVLTLLFALFIIFVLVKYVFSSRSQNRSTPSGQVDR